jgi:hypothetical protein
MIFRDESFQTVADTQNRSDTVTIVGFHDNGTNHIVLSRDRDHAGDNSYFCFVRIKINMFSGACLFKVERGSLPSFHIFPTVFRVKKNGDRGIINIRSRAGLSILGVPVVIMWVSIS